MSTNMANADRALCADSDQRKMAPAHSTGDAARDKAEPKIFSVTAECGSDATADVSRTPGKFEPGAFLAQLRAMLKAAGIAMPSAADADVAEFVARLKSLTDADGDSVEPELNVPQPKRCAIPRGARVLRMRQLVERTGLSRATLYVLMATDPKFPSKIQLTVRTIGFYEHSVDAWLASRAQMRATA